ncbi:MAG: hypothetical protein PWP23_821 [Candidatus Sumerlaeota bacterium]|nr:hypothetical protein [Candidatus Sumerlaeota bacterium]
MTRRQHIAARGQEGFTLMELMVVLALLSVIAALVAPQLRGFVTGRASTEECRRFAALTEYAREHAIGNAVRVALWVDEDGDSYGLRDTRTSRDIYTYQTATGLTITPFDEEGEALEEDTELVIWPDGEIDFESPASYHIDEKGTTVFVIELNENGTRYEVTTP